MIRHRSSEIAPTGFVAVSDFDPGRARSMTADHSPMAPPEAAHRVSVLFLAKQFPWPLNVGSRQRVFHLIKGIAASHDVITIAYDALPSTHELNAFASASGCRQTTVVPRSTTDTKAEQTTSIARLFSRAARGARVIKSLVGSPLPAFARDLWSDSLVSAIKQTARENSIDVVYATQSWMAEHARAAGLGAIMVDVDDLISLMSRQLLASVPWGVRKPLRLLEAAKDVSYERSLPQRFSHVVVAKAEDQEFFRPEARSRVSVIPNGITIRSAPLPQPAVADHLLFVGTLGYEPNIDAVRWFATEALPLIWQHRPDVRLDVAGFGSGAALRDVLSDSRCALHESPPDLTPLYARAAVVIAPVRIGGGTRIKILEALANGRAMVSTAFAAEGLSLRGGTDIEFADSPGAIAALCVALLGDESRRRALAASGRARVAEQFDWERIERRLPKLITDFVDHRTAVDARPASTPG